MNQLVKLIYQERFERVEDINPISRRGEERFNREIRPLLKEKLSFEEINRVDDGIANLMSALIMGGYLSGVQDLIELLSYKGDLSDLSMKGGATA